MSTRLADRPTRLPTTRAGVIALLAAAAAAVVGLWLLNERVWTWAADATPASWHGTRALEAAQFFFYDVAKISLLLASVIFAVTLLRGFISIERTRALLGGKREGVGNVLAATLGIATPFCSCSAVPVFIGFVSAGVPLGVTLSFLIASPLVNEIAVALLWTTFGWKVAVLYMAAGLVIAVTAGWIIGRMRPERWVADFVLKPKARPNLLGGADAAKPLVERRPRPDERLREAGREVASIVGKVWPYLLVGVALGAAIHGWAPTEWFAEHASADNPWGVLIAVALGVPLYSNAAGALPLVEALAGQGVPMGTLLAFMMSVVALSLPELILLKRVLKLPLIAAFVGVVATGIIAVGYLFNAILG